MFSDLECDYINPIDLCNKLNQVRLFFPLSSLDRGFDAFSQSLSSPRTLPMPF
jgi:hypothetical protein